MRQLTAGWSEDGKHAVISRGDEVLVRHPVTFSGRTHSWLTPGTGKLAHYGSSGIGVINLVRNGCFRKYTGVERCDEGCYSEVGNPQSGCYADLTTQLLNDVKHDR